MSKVNKRKHVMKEMQTDDFDPPESNQQIVRILCSRGNNLHEVESAEPIAIDDADNESAYRFLVTMPTKFRKNVWVKRGDFVIVEPIDEGDKVKAEIVRILTAQHIKEFKKMGIWPQKFTNKSDNDSMFPSDYTSDPNYVNDDDLFVNTNRAPMCDEESLDSTDSDSDEESEDEESEDNSNDDAESDDDCADDAADTGGNDDTGCDDTGAGDGDAGCVDDGGGDDGGFDCGDGDD